MNKRHLPTLTDGIALVVVLIAFFAFTVTLFFWMYGGHNIVWYWAGNLIRSGLLSIVSLLTLLFPIRVLGWLIRLANFVSHLLTQLGFPVRPQTPDARNSLWMRCVSILLLGAGLLNIRVIVLWSMERSECFRILCVWGV